MAGDVLKQLLLCIRASDFYALQLDESTDVAGLAQLLAFVQYIHEGTIKEDMLFWKTTGNEDNWEGHFQNAGHHNIKWTCVVKMCWHLYRWRKGHDGET